MAEAVERIPQHRHCGACGNAHTNKGRFCSDACMEKKKIEINKKKRQLFVLWIIAAAVLVGVVIWELLQ